MKIAMHLRHPGDWNTACRHLSALLVRYCSDHQSVPLIHRVYIGDEFCPNRLPSLKELDQFFQMAEERSLHITLLTPVLTDEQLDQTCPLFDRLLLKYPETEVVVNDLGVLLFLKKQYPLFQLSVGRLMNKGFKDPRLGNPEELSMISEEAREVLSDCIFEHKEFIDQMTAFSAIRLERDLLPYGKIVMNNTGTLKTSIYFPFGYVTTGRVCWTATFRQHPGKRFIPAGECDRPCTDMSFEMKNDSISFRLFQNGNTIYYLYTPKMIISLFQAAAQHPIRLIYQNSALRQLL